MRKILCTIPEGRYSTADVLRLEEVLRDRYAEHFGRQHRILILWSAVPAGQAFTEGRVAEVNVGLIQVDDDLDQAKRERAMMDFAHAWAETAGVDVDALIITMTDAGRVNQYLSANRNRLRWYSRPGYVLGTIAHLLQSRRQLGYARLRANL